MPGAETGRQFQRHALQFPIRYLPAEADSTRLQTGWTHNLSEGGVAVELNERLPPATRLRVWLFTDRGSLPVEGQVVWEVPAPQTSGGVLHGVAFTTLTPEQVEDLRRLTSPEEIGRRGAPRFSVHRPITCRVQEGEAGPVDGETGNVSRGGLLLRMTLALPLGTTIAFTLPTPQGAITGTGEVDWVEAPERHAPGEPIHHGFRFTAMGWADACALAVLVTDPYEVKSPPDAPAS
jgi:hypothetical protein